MPQDSEPAQLPLAERMEKCPIHQWTNVDSYLDKTQVPKHLYEPFHEIVVARGEYPWHIDALQAKKFAKKAREITEMYEMNPDEGQRMLVIFKQVTDQWVNYRSKLQ